MSKKIYETGYVRLIDNTELEISPLKLKYFREFMDEFNNAALAKNDDELMDTLIKCVAISMKQFNPPIATYDLVADNINVPGIYDVLNFAANIKMGHWKEDDKKSTSSDLNAEKSSWESLDLNKLEAEVFLIGAWKNYDELEKSLCMAELLLTIESKRDLDYQEKKFLAAMQGVDLDENNASSTTKEDPWEALQARVEAKISGMGSDNPNDITAFQGIRAAKAGFGIGMGLDYATEI